jgi:acetyl esterase
MLKTSMPRIGLDESIKSPFDPRAILPETHALNEQIIHSLSNLPDQWGFAPFETRKRREQGIGPFPLHPKCEHAEWREIEGRAGPLRLYIIRPQSQPSRGIYLHFHSGGWTYGAPDMQDPWLQAYVEGTGLTTISVEYRLAPEHPYPAALEDGLSASLWAVTRGVEEFGSHLVIGGESSGGHIAALTLFRLRDRFDLTPFAAANLVAGYYDLSLTPSVRRWGSKRLVVSTRDVEMFIKQFVPGHVDPHATKVSPLYSKTSDLPPALFTIGTMDPFLDDTLFMAARWEAGGNRAERYIVPGGCHLFQMFDCTITQESHKKTVEFINHILKEREASQKPSEERELPPQDFFTAGNGHGNGNSHHDGDEILSDNPPPQDDTSPPSMASASDDTTAPHQPEEAGNDVQENALPDHKHDFDSEQPASASHSSSHHPSQDNSQEPSSRQDFNTPPDVPSVPSTPPSFSRIQAMQKQPSNGSAPASDPDAAEEKSPQSEENQPQLSAAERLMQETGRSFPRPDNAEHVLQSPSDQDVRQE